MADGGELDPTVERLRLCVEQGRTVTVEEGGFRLGDDLVVPKVRRGGVFMCGSRWWQSTCVGLNRTCQLMMSAVCVYVSPEQRE